MQEQREHGAASPVGGGATLGAAGGLVVGLFAPPLLAATAIGAGIGALKKRHEEKQLGVDIEEYLPPGSSAVIVVADDRYADRIDKALTKRARRSTRRSIPAITRSSPRSSTPQTSGCLTPLTPDRDGARARKAAPLRTALASATTITRLG